MMFVDDDNDDVVVDDDDCCEFRLKITPINLDVWKKGK
jgi:hypothetical protein